MATEVKIKKWGNSLAIILPKELVIRKLLKENDNINVELIKEADLRKVFGTLKTKKSAQQLKDDARSGWD